MIVSKSIKDDICDANASKDERFKEESQYFIKKPWRSKHSGLNIFGKLSRNE